MHAVLCCSSIERDIYELTGNYRFQRDKELTGKSGANEREKVGEDPRVVIGAGSRIEVGMNLNGNIQPGPDSTTLSPTFKWKAYNGGDNGWAFVVGDNMFIPVRNRSYDVGNYVDAQFSKTFVTKMRVTFGGYHFSPDVVAPGANRAGGQFAIEQPITSYLTVQADWYTGKHAAGYFTPGVAFKPHPKVTGYFGYSIGNAGVSRGNHFFYSAIGININ